MALTKIKTGIISNGSVTLPKMADISTGSIIGRNAAGDGTPEVLTPDISRTILDVYDTSTVDTNIGVAQSAADAAQGDATQALSDASAAQSTADGLYTKSEVDDLADEAQGAGLAFAIVFG